MEREIQKRLSIVFPEEKHKDIKLVATELGLTMKDFVDQAIAEKIELVKHARYYR